MAKALTDYLHSYDIEGSLHVLPHKNPLIIVQEYIPHNVELRLYVVKGSLEKTMYTKMREKDGGTFGKFERRAEVDKTVKTWMKNDLEALADGEEQAKALIGQWLKPPDLPFYFL